jgi:hypothetical protein
MSSLIFESDALEMILQQIYPAQSALSLRYISWCLYIICKKYYEPTSTGLLLSDKQINYIQSLFGKLAELLFRDDSTQELAIVVILALGRFIHMHPPSDLLTDVLQNMTITILSAG